jgi:CDP-diacylglycerol---serine O-phosphatidyltransferase
VKAKHLVPNAVTLTNIAFGFLAVVAAAQGQFERGTVFLFFAALCDLFDGGLARLLNASSKFGMELDSLSDAISFGIAPSVLVYLSVLHKLGPLGIAIAVAYPLCGVLRLARYNLDTSDESAYTFRGCPIPIAAGYLMSFVMVRDRLPEWLIAAGVAFLALMMISKIKMPKFRRRGGSLPVLFLYIGVWNFAAFLIWTSALTWHIWNTWNILLVIAHHVVLWRRAGREEEPEQIRRAA